MARSEQKGLRNEAATRTTCWQLDKWVFHVLTTGTRFSFMLGPPVHWKLCKNQCKKCRGTDRKFGLINISWLKQRGMCLLCVWGRGPCILYTPVNGLHSTLQVVRWKWCACYTGYIGYCMNIENLSMDINSMLVTLYNRHIVIVHIVHYLAKAT